MINASSGVGYNYTCMGGSPSRGGISITSYKFQGTMSQPIVAVLIIGIMLISLSSMLLRLHVDGSASFSFHSHIMILSHKILIYTIFYLFLYMYRHAMNHGVKKIYLKRNDLKFSQTTEANL